MSLVSGAVAGDDLSTLASAAAQAIDGTVAVAIPGCGAPVVCPPGSLSAEQVATLDETAAAVIVGTATTTGHVPVRIGERTVGVVLSFTSTGHGAPRESRAWLEAMAAAASVASLLRDEPENADAALLAELAAGRPRDLPALLARARRLGLDLAPGAVAICARRARSDQDTANPTPLPVSAGALVAELGDGRVFGLVPLNGGRPEELADQLRGLAMRVAVSAPRRDPMALPEALREAELLVELSVTAPEVQLAGPDDTYRLLIGVMLRDPDELTNLRERTISPLSVYDARHDTDLVETLRAFLEHHGSTTETADAMRLHRHTVGYRLSRVHEVSGLSPYESDGRERLGLGLKAHQILDANERLSAWRRRLGSTDRRHPPFRVRPLNR